VADVKKQLAKQEAIRAKVEKGQGPRRAKRALANSHDPELWTPAGPGGGSFLMASSFIRMRLNELKMTRQEAEEGHEKNLQIHVP
jgi:hypothetical protein